jgi:hypothetical protein
VLQPRGTKRTATCAPTGPRTVRTAERATVTSYPDASTDCRTAAGFRRARIASTVLPAPPAHRPEHRAGTARPLRTWPRRTLLLILLLSRTRPAVPGLPQLLVLPCRATRSRDGPRDIQAVPGPQGPLGSLRRVRTEVLPTRVSTSPTAATGSRHPGLMAFPHRTVLLEHKESPGCTETQSPTAYPGPTAIPDRTEFPDRRAPPGRTEFLHRTATPPDRKEPPGHQVAR